jgi:hypothetical protein
LPTVAVGVVAVLLSACGAGDDGGVAETGSPPPSSTSTTAPPAVEGMSATIEQGRPYIARDLLELFLRSDAAGTVEIVALRLVDPRFEVIEPVARGITIPPGLGPRSMPMPYGAPRCGDATPPPDPPVVEVTRADGSIVPVPVDPAGQDFLTVFHTDKCEVQRIGELVSLRWSTPIVAVDGATIQVPLLVERRSGDGPVTIEEIGGTVVFADRLVDAGSVPVTLAPGTSRAVIAVELSAARCEAHALTESNKTFRFSVWVRLGSGPSHRVEVLPEGEPRAALESAMRNGCFGTLD